MNSYIIFCDGACKGNPGPGGWAAIVIESSGEVEEIGGYSPQTTNNQMELLAATEALRKTKQGSKVQIFTDSTYVIRGITEWIWGWKKRNWTTAQGELVLNKEYWQNLQQAGFGREIVWTYVRGHSGIAGNERVDEIAVAYSHRTELNSLSLFRGSVENYSVPIFPLPPGEPIKKTNHKTSSGAQTSKESGHKIAPSYLCLINGVVTEYPNWTSCEKAVKGISGAKFKKISSEKEKSDTLKSWGVH